MRLITSSRLIIAQLVERHSICPLIDRYAHHGDTSLRHSVGNRRLCWHYHDSRQDSYCWMMCSITKRMTKRSSSSELTALASQLYKLITNSEDPPFHSRYFSISSKYSHQFPNHGSYRYLLTYLQRRRPDQGDTQTTILHYPFTCFRLRRLLVLRCYTCYRYGVQGILA